MEFVAVGVAAAFVVVFAMSAFALLTVVVSEAFADAKVAAEVEAVGVEEKKSSEEKNSVLKMCRYQKSEQALQILSFGIFSNECMKS